MNILAKMMKSDSEERKRIFETANRYHFIHTLALLAVPLSRHPKTVSSIVYIGTCVISIDLLGIFGHVSRHDFILWDLLLRCFYWGHYLPQIHTSRGFATRFGMGLFYALIRVFI